MKMEDIYNENQEDWVRSTAQLFTMMLEDQDAFGRTMDAMTTEDSMQYMSCLAAMYILVTQAGGIPQKAAIAAMGITMQTLMPQGKWN